MATRRIPLIPPPPFVVAPAQGDAERAGADDGRGAAENRGEEKRGADGERGVAPKAQQGARAYRGKSSGEFARVGGVGADLNALVVEAEGWISKLTDDDNYRRLLKLAVLRRDVVLLSGLLDALHRR